MLPGACSGALILPGVKIFGHSSDFGPRFILIRLWSLLETKEWSTLKMLRESATSDEGPGTLCPQEC